MIEVTLTPCSQHDWNSRNITQQPVQLGKLSSNALDCPNQLSPDYFRLIIRPEAELDIQAPPALSHPLWRYKRAAGHYWRRIYPVQRTLALVTDSAVRL